MNSLYIIVIYLLNASTGELEQEYRSSTPMTLDSCMESLIARGPIPAKDGLAQFAFCKKVESGVEA